ncbi:MAG: tol-pal system-associated acyl-CoA thioesterase [Betaproteobacteria bacterium]|nr:tol-pal system-associated acyl-CoA thioesterase [Rhodocyclales bacterium]
MMPAPAVLALRVYYEDTDAAGIVYYANYLRFLERGRTEWLRALGHDQNMLMKEGIAFAVRSVSAEFLKPARLDDQLSVETSVASLGRAQLTFAQRILRDNELLLDAKIRVACIDPGRGRAIPMPRALHQQFSALRGPEQ